MHWPEPGEIRVVWSLCRDQRERPVALATLAIALILVSGGDSCAIHRVSQGLLQGLTGSLAGGSFTDRLGELTELGVIERAGARWADGVRVGARMFEVELERSVGERFVNLQSVGPRPELPVSRMLRCSAPIQDYDDLELEGHETQVIGWGPPRLASAG